MRAEIRAGELLAQMDERNERAKWAATIGPKLSDLGINKSQSSRWQKLASLPKEDQEAKIQVRQTGFPKSRNLCFVFRVFGLRHDRRRLASLHWKRRAAVRCSGKITRRFVPHNRLKLSNGADRARLRT
jgi:hypothetical protein